ncbi:hypothetical protein PHYBLDRAFT_169491 [Phycomyces blakesleeanus NRRL 1555(-)]|uniref:Uncharacterized protein n=1 Tax=Phycomyces blakesleeanus (strain ATCC 8743b / DSM 1359 / FGSC 10004 / NBRC 33097 / NRRL 1555) TaxID=763407 RepID=A0A162U4W6_PHYB8|nr:hypothetical protein PHYBLDRAFT_169491 [Phycomyces blakesleeanus NRRL 1555(-)]OAD72353.1 hypothetical protein PHYBLDRAFT_169491 [Phycomyces blakesleeanus NRRL 1555(-)]|eukprot:XP_018290393.1 hypothetical protein PHYBLDRAFT_169491 [Phycomyces blakesleeanus NRRL 1555(-)]
MQIKTIPILHSIANELKARECTFGRKYALQDKIIRQQKWNTKNCYMTFTTIGQEASNKLSVLMSGTNLLQEVGTICTGDIYLFNVGPKLGSLNLLAFRKMRFSSKVYYEQNDANLVRNLRRKFGSDYALVPSAWTAPTVKLYEPIISTEKHLYELQSTGNRPACFSCFTDSNSKLEFKRRKMVPCQTPRKPNILLESYRSENLT